MKKIMLIAVIITSITSFAANTPAAVNEKVLKAFKETFTVAEDITWHEYDDYVQANFRQNQIQVRAMYNEDGQLLRTTRYYGESNLLPNITAKLKKKYNGKAN